jgi:hypothetical protein
MFGRAAGGEGEAFDGGVEVCRWDRREHFEDRQSSSCRPVVSVQHHTAGGGGFDGGADLREVFAVCEWGQTLFGPLTETAEVEPVRPGSGTGAFVVVTAQR